MTETSMEQKQEETTAVVVVQISGTGKPIRRKKNKA